MMDLIKKLNYGSRWNAIEAISYKAILATHQTLLFYSASRFIYGFTSLIFAIIYLTVELVNLGFDRSIAQLSKDYFNSGKTFKNYFVPQVIMQIILASLVAFLLVQNYSLIGICFSEKFNCAFLTQPQWALISIIILLESIRKTLRIIAQLLFLNKAAAIIELSLICFYIASFWTSILTGHEVGIYTIYLPLAAQSAIGITSLLYFIIPQINLRNQDDTIELSWLNIIKQRTSNYAYQISEMLFSSNFLIYFLTTMIGVSNIGLVKLANYIAVFIKALLEKTFGLTSLSVLARAQNLPEEQKRLFNISQKRLSFLLTTLCSLYLIFAIGTIAVISHNNLQLALMFFGFTLVSNFLIVYEQLFYIQGKILILLVLNIVSASILLSLICLYKISATSIISTLVALRIVTVLIVRKLANSISAKTS